MTWSGSGNVFTPAAPLGLERGWTEVTVSTGPALGELNTELVGAGAGAEVELEAAPGGFLLALAGLSLRLRSAQSGQGK